MSRTLPEAELGDVARDRRLDDLVAPGSRSASASSACVAIGRSRTSRRIAPWRSPRRCHAERSAEDRERLVDLVLADDERRRQPQDVSARGADDEAGLEARGDDGPGRPVELASDQQAPARAPR